MGRRRGMLTIVWVLVLAGGGLAAVWWWATDEPARESRGLGPVGLPARGR